MATDRTIFHENGGVNLNELLSRLSQEENGKEDTLVNELCGAKNKQLQLTHAIAELETCAKDTSADREQQALLLAYCSKTKKTVFTPETIHFATEATLRLLWKRKQPHPNSSPDSSNFIYCRSAIERAKPADFNKTNFFAGLALLLLGAGSTIVAGCSLGTSFGATALFAVTLAKANFVAPLVTAFYLALRLSLKALLGQKSCGTKTILFGLASLNGVASVTGTMADIAPFMGTAKTPPTPGFLMVNANISIASSALTALIGFGMFCDGVQMMWKECASHHAGKTYQDTAKRALGYN